MVRPLFQRLLSKYVIARICLLTLFTGCRSLSLDVSPDKITSINIIDRNGMSETISSQDRLGSFNKTNFLAPQPYQKVLRNFGKDKNGTARSCITSYHPNGQIKQYLEAVNNRAYGTYREWHPNGQLKVNSTVIGGQADINTQAEESWLFDGKSYAWNEEGTLLAEISYSKGELDGLAEYYHSNGTLWKISPYVKDCLHGTQQIYLEDGALFHVIEYREGAKEGKSLRYWKEGQMAYEELYHQGSLTSANYYNQDGNSTSTIANGSGFRTIFGKESLQSLQEYRNGTQEGVVKIFNRRGDLIRTYSVKNEEKYGEEIDYYPLTQIPKLLMSWQNGILEGPVKTWFENGTLESQKEMSQNKKNGLSTAWYRNGTLMLVEEYENDILLKGEYYRMGEKAPLSTIEKGKGIANLFNSEGNFSKKIYYHDGKPLD